MSYKNKVFNYGNKLEPYQQSELMSAIKKCLSDGYTYEWVWKALKHKEEDEWKKFGYGLMFNKGFRTEISNKLIKTEKENKDTVSIFDSLDSLPDDSSSVFPSVSSFPSDFECVAGSSTLNQSSSVQEKEENISDDIKKLIRYDRQADFGFITYAGNDLYIAYPTDWGTSIVLSSEELSRIRNRKWNIEELDKQLITNQDKQDYDIAIRAFLWSKDDLGSKQISIHNPKKIKEKLDNGYELIANHQWFNKDTKKYLY